MTPLRHGNLRLQSKPLHDDYALYCAGRNRRGRCERMYRLSVFPSERKGARSIYTRCQVLPPMCFFGTVLHCITACVVPQFAADCSRFVVDKGREPRVMEMFLRSSDRDDQLLYHYCINNPTARFPTGRAKTTATTTTTAHDRCPVPNWHGTCSILTPAAWRPSGAASKLSQNSRVVVSPAQVLVYGARSPTLLPRGTGLNIKPRQWNAASHWPCSGLENPVLR